MPAERAIRIQGEVTSRVGPELAGGGVGDRVSRPSGGFRPADHLIRSLDIHVSEINTKLVASNATSTVPPAERSPAIAARVSCGAGHDMGRCRAC